MTSIDRLENYPEFVFVGGAGRSGTSLMYWLFDWHPEIMVFLGEVPVISKYWMNPETQREDYFRNSFLSAEEGKQARFVDPDALANFNQKMSREFKGFNNPTALDINTELFRKTYLESLDRDKKHLLRRIFEGLGKGLIAGCSKLSTRYELNGTKYFLYKLPFYTELYAQRIASIIPKSKFIHMVRSPKDRYISAKMFQLRQRSSKVNGVDFCFAHTETWIASRFLAEKNLEALGDEKYRIVYYEKLIADTDKEMRKLAVWLGIRFSDSLLMPTVLGLNAGDNSSFNNRSRRKIANFSKRKEDFMRFTSLSERLQFYYLLGIAGDYLGEYEIPPISRWMTRCFRWIPFKFESREDYLSRIRRKTLDPTSITKKKLRNILINRLPARAERKYIDVS